MSPSHLGHSCATSPGFPTPPSVGIVSGGSFLFVACTASERHSYGCLNDHQDLFKGSQNLTGARKGKVSLQGGTRCVRVEVCCVLSSGSDPIVHSVSHAVIVKEDE